MSEGATVALEGVRFSHASADGTPAFRLDVPALQVEPGERVACVGPSGTGKTTLVEMIAGIRLPDAGSVRLEGVELTRASEAARRALRLQTVGMVFQEFALLEYASALDNVLLPYHLSSRLHLTPEVTSRAHSLAERLGIEALLRRRPGRLSQGERQRVALCRALVTQPVLVLCDEATGNLDPQTAGAAVDLLLEQARASGAAVFLVTHDHSLLPRFDRVVDMTDLVGSAGVPA